MNRAQSSELRDGIQQVDKVVNERPSNTSLSVVIQAYLKSTYADKNAMQEVRMPDTSMLCVCIFVSTFLIYMNNFFYYEDHHTHDKWDSKGIIFFK